jgi:hypothetical protein
MFYRTIACFITEDQQKAQSTPSLNGHFSGSSLHFDFPIRFAKLANRRSAGHVE